MPQKPAKTAADYMAIAACPALIILLIGSLVFFLLQIGYSGQWIGRLQWTLFWFVFAMVLVSRIAIERSSGAAVLYGLALAGATSLLLAQYVGFLWGVWLLLALIWWASNKMVLDCTLIDDDQDASGQGLMQVSRLDHWARRPIMQVRAVPASELKPKGDLSTSPPPPRTPVTAMGAAYPALHSFGTPRKPQNIQARKTANSKRKQDAHSPGLWVLYFSFAAVPVFGLGELLLDSNDTTGRQSCFFFLTIYLTSALGLLLLTSFLGLRRYLRQRCIMMPPAMARRWITTGSSIALGVLMLALLLPRPATPYSIAAWITKLSTPPPKASETALPSSQGGEGKSSGQASTNQSPQLVDDSEEKEQDRSNLGRNQADHQRESKNSGGQNIGVNQRYSPPSLPVQLEKWISYILVTIILMALIFRFWPQIREILKQIIALFCGFSVGTPRNRSLPKTSTIQSSSKVVRLLPNPFQSGQADRMTLAELVQYSFEGLMAWAESRGFHLNESETPLEFAERLSQREQALTQDILLLSSYYSHVAYGGQLRAEDPLVVLKRLWFVIGFVSQRPR